MATMDFPASPSTGDIHTHSGKRWQWDGAVWRAYSLAFTGTPVAPTAAAGTDTTQIATTAYVQTELEVIPGIGNTLTFEGSSADDFETTLTVVDPTADRTVTLQNADGTVALTSDLATYAPLADPTFTGTPDAPTAAADTNTTQIATTAYVQTELGAISSDSLSDADSDTKIQVEEASDEDKIRFDTGGTERAVIDSSGLEIKSGGLKLDGLNSSDSNCLDDYEEGSWTVVVTCGTSGTITLDSLYDTAAYVKIGKVVHIQGYVYVSAISSPVGQLKLSLPFTTSHTSMPELSDYSQGSTTIRDAGTNLPGVTYHVTVPNETVLRVVGGGGQTAHIDTAAGYVKATTSFWIGGTYRTDT